MLLFNGRVSRVRQESERKKKTLKKKKKRAKGKNKGYENQYKIEKTTELMLERKKPPSLYNDKKTLILIIEQHSSLGGN
jgi:hypothetical protein